MREGTRRGGTRCCSLDLKPTVVVAFRDGLRRGDHDVEVVRHRSVMTETWRFVDRLSGRHSAERDLVRGARMTRFLMARRAACTLIVDLLSAPSMKVRRYVHGRRHHHHHRRGSALGGTSDVAGRAGSWRWAAIPLGIDVRVPTYVGWDLAFRPPLGYGDKLASRTPWGLAEPSLA